MDMSANLFIQSSDGVNENSGSQDNTDTVRDTTNTAGDGWEAILTTDGGEIFKYDIGVIPDWMGSVTIHFGDDEDDENPVDDFMRIEKVIFNPPATVVYWEDGSKTVVKVDNVDNFSEEVGLAEAIAKRYFGNNRSEFKRVLKNAYRQPSK